MSKLRYGGHLEEVADDLANAWLNGQRAEVVKVLKSYRGLRCGLLSILVCDRLSPHDQQLFVNRLSSET